MVNKVYYGRCAKGKLNKKYGRYLSVQKTNVTVVCQLTFMSILKHSGSNYGMENNVTSQISGSFTSDCVKIMGLCSLVGKKGK